MSAAKVIDIAEVRRLYEQHTPDGCAARGTVNKWIVARQIPQSYTSPKRRVFDRGAVLKALAKEFEREESFLSVADAFALARRPYPTPRGRRSK